MPKNFSQDLECTIKLGFALEEARNESKSRLRNLVESVTGKKVVNKSPSKFVYKLRHEISPNNMSSIQRIGSDSKAMLFPEINSSRNEDKLSQTLAPPTLNSLRRFAAVQETTIGLLP